MNFGNRLAVKVAGLAAALTFGIGSPVAARTTSDATPTSALWAGGEKFIADDIASIALEFDELGMPALDVAFTPAAGARRATETARLRGLPVDFKLGERLIEQPIVAEPITGGTLRISGSQTVPDIKSLIRDIACRCIWPRIV